LKDNPEEIKELSAARSAIETIEQIENLKVVGLEVNAMGLFLEYSRKYGLLSNDALHLATMNQEGIVTLASNDRTLRGSNGLIMEAVIIGPDFCFPHVMARE